MPKAAAMFGDKLWMYVSGRPGDLRERFLLVCPYHFCIVLVLYRPAFRHPPRAPSGSSIDDAEPHGPVSPGLYVQVVVEVTPTCRTNAAAVMSSGNSLPSTTCSTRAPSINTREATPVHKNARCLLRRCRSSSLGRSRLFRSFMPLLLWRLGSSTTQRTNSQRQNRCGRLTHR